MRITICIAFILMSFGILFAQEVVAPNSRMADSAVNITPASHTIAISIPDDENTPPPPVTTDPSGKDDKGVGLLTPTHTSVSCWA